MNKVITLAQRVKSDAEELSQILEKSDSSLKGPSSQTKANAKWQKKVGLATKSYKLKTVDTDAFKAACEANNESQSAVLTKMMAAYVEGQQPIVNTLTAPAGCLFCRLKPMFKTNKSSNKEKRGEII